MSLTITLPGCCHQLLPDWIELFRPPPLANISTNEPSGDSACPLHHSSLMPHYFTNCCQECRKCEIVIMSAKHEAEHSKWGHHIQNLIPSLDKRLLHHKSTSKICQPKCSMPRYKFLLGHCQIKPCWRIVVPTWYLWENNPITFWPDLFKNLF